MASSIVTIPKKVSGGEELVVIPRKQYETLLRRQKVVPVIKMTSTQKKDLEEARREYKKGEYITLEQLEHELGITPKKTH